jgi:uncharacterized membrane protein (UPF0127 family)
MDRALRKNPAIIIIMSIAIVMILLLAWFMWYREEGSETKVTFDLQADVTFHCELADTDAERSMGLMYREELEPDRGMLFVFDNPQNVSFWMKNTYIPLDIIFIDEDGIVVNILEAYPEPGVPDGNLTRYNSASPVKWVLEVNQGMSRIHGIVPGTMATIH